MDMQSLLFDFYWQYFKVLLIDVHKENITFFVMINDKVGLSTAYSCKHHHHIFQGFCFSSVIPRCMDYFSLLPPPGFCNWVFIPNKCIRPQPLQIGLPKSPLPRSCILNSSSVAPAPRRRHIYEKVSSQTLLTTTTQVTFSD